MSQKDEAQHRAWFTVDELNAWADKKLKENPQWEEQPAQQALDKMAENAREIGLDYEPVWNNLPSNKDVEDAMRLKRLSQLSEQPAQRETAAWTLLLTGEHHGLVGKSGEKFVGAPDYYKRVDVYTSPRRTWVGLTVEDENKLLEAVIGSLPIAKNLIRAIEAKLKEKNNG